TRDAVLDDLLAASAGYATLLITHGLARLEEMGEIYVIVDGRVVQRGSHDEPLAEKGWYRNAHGLGDPPRGGLRAVRCPGAAAVGCPVRPGGSAGTGFAPQGRSRYG